MNAAWAFAIVLCVILVLFVILPSFTRSKPVAITHPVTRRVRSDAPQPTPTCKEPTVAQMSLAQEQERCIDRDMLKSFYPPPLTETTPVD